jgi:hypothetical protein
MHKNKIISVFYFIFLKSEVFFDFFLIFKFFLEKFWRKLGIIIQDLYFTV